MCNEVPGWTVGLDSGNIPPIRSCDQKIPVKTGNTVWYGVNKNQRRRRIFYIIDTTRMWPREDTHNACDRQKSKNDRLSYRRVVLAVPTTRSASPVRAPRPMIMPQHSSPMFPSRPHRSCHQQTLSSTSASRPSGKGVSDRHKTKRRLIADLGCSHLQG